MNRKRKVWFVIEPIGAERWMISLSCRYLQMFAFKQADGRIIRGYTPDVERIKIERMTMKAG